MDWVHLAQGRDRWRALENAIMNLRDPWHYFLFGSPILPSISTSHLPITCSIHFSLYTWTTFGQQKCLHFNAHDEGKVANGIFSLRRI
jgi:hypothetical protein